ncbi:hypothetical protein C8R45DRAFT_427213 [Mycena sanguinolenta]|nr:hypothetical protein C8R45DRAFT_427213 [Mycena sanguinolenta]
MPRSPSILNFAFLSSILQPIGVLLPVEISVFGRRPPSMWRRRRLCLLLARMRATYLVSPVTALSSPYISRYLFYAPKFTSLRLHPTTLTVLPHSRTPQYNLFPPSPFASSSSLQHCVAVTKYLMMMSYLDECR